MQHIRNFSIIAHIDHGKSTLADRLIEMCGGLSAREMKSQVLDGMELEREKGITIKAQSVTLSYCAQDGKNYQFNIIDTPGHVDFSYEVSRSLAAVEGALLIVDAAQGVEAQTVAVCYTAIEQSLVMLPVLNKIDLPQADPMKVAEQIEDVIGIDATGAVSVSAKTGVGLSELMERIVADIPPPEGDPEKPLQALIVDSWFDNYLGIVSLVRIKNGALKKGDKIKIMSTNACHEVTDCGVFQPKKFSKKQLACGEVGYIVAGIKDIKAAPVGDTITLDKHEAKSSLPGFARAKPQVYAGLFPVSSELFPAFREALEKLSLNDASLDYEIETSDALGHGFRCGFLGLLHMEIISERLDREYDMQLIMTAPTVVYEVTLKTGEFVLVDRPGNLPPVMRIQEIKEPIARVQIYTPEAFVGDILSLCMEKRGVQKDMQFMPGQVSLNFMIPMGEIILDFFDRLKSISRGYASLDYHFDHYKAGKLVKLDFLINGEKVDALATIVHQEKAYQMGKAITEKLKELIPRQMFAIAIQAVVGAKIISRETVSAMRKNVLAKCYGGDVSRKKKLLAKQAKGKKRMKQFGRVSIPQEAFLAVLKLNDK